MKRTPLARTTPLKRSASHPKRRKPAYPPARALTERAAWSFNFKTCWVCGTEWGLQTHEMASRAIAPKQWADPRNYFRACGTCNCDFLNWCPEDVQLALKAIYDPDNYDREFVNGLRHRAENAITEQTVWWWMKVLETQR